MSTAARAAVIYTGGSVVAALLFVAGALAAGEDWVAVLGGGLWVFILSMIILMSTVTPLLAERAGRERTPHH